MVIVSKFFEKFNYKNDGSRLIDKGVFYMIGCKNVITNIVVLIISIIIAFIVFNIFSTTLVTGLVALLYTIFGISVFSLIVLLSMLFKLKGKEEQCICEFGPFLLIGIFGTIIFSILTIALTVEATILTILISIIAFFASLQIIELKSSQPPKLIFTEFRLPASLTKIIVPKGAASNYKKAWADYSDLIVEK